MTNGISSKNRTFVQDNSIPFLDVLVNAAEHDWWYDFHLLGKKKTFTGLYTKSDSFRTAKNFETTVPYEFFAFTSQVGIFFVDERKTKILGLEDVMEKGIIKFLTFLIRQISSIIFGK